MRKPSSSNSVSEIQRFSDMANTPTGPSHVRLFTPFRTRLADREPERRRSSAADLRHRSGALPAQDLADGDALGLERLAQHRDACVRLGLAAHEHVEGRVARLGPGM